MLLDSISEAQTFVDVFAYVYIIALLLYVLTSWVRLPYALQPVQRFLHEVCDPYLRLWRRILPSFGPLDLSPIVGILAVEILARIIDYILGRF